MINNQINNISSGVQGNEVDETEVVVDEVTESTQPSTETAIVPTSSPLDPTMAGRVEVMRSNPRNASEIIAGIKNGDPAALEHMWLGSHPDGSPKISYIDDFGKPQYHNLTVAQWMGIKEARSLNRTRLVEYQEEQEELQQSREENQGAFTTGLGALDDGSNPMLSAVLKDMYNNDPIGTLTKMYDLQYLEAKDEDAAAARKFQIVNNAMSEQSNQTFQRFGQTLDRYFGDQTLEYQRLLDKDPNNPQIRGALQQHETNMSVFRKGMGFKPYPGMDMSQSPGQAYTNPARRVDMYRSWMEMLSIGVPTATGQHRYTVNNPQDLEAWESERDDLVMHLEWLSRQLGWQGSFINPNTGMLNMEDEVAIRKAYSQVFNNPAVLMANQQSNPALSSQGTQYPGSAPTQQGLPGGVPWAPGQAPPQQGLTPLQQVPLPTGTPGAQQLTPQQQPPPQSQIDLDRGAAPFGDPLELKIVSDVERLARRKASETGAAIIADAEVEKIKNEVIKGTLEIKKLVVELEQLSNGNDSGVLEILTKLYPELEYEKPKKDAKGNVLPTSKERVMELIELYLDKIDPNK